MASIRRVLGSRIALGAALLASACQHDSNADFDDSNLNSSDGGSTAVTSGTGSGAAAGEADAGSSAGGSSAAEGGASAGSGGKPASSAGMGGTATGGKASGGSGGKGSSGSAGTGNEAGKNGGGGSAGSTGGGGKGGGPVIPPDPEPVTFTTKDIDDTHVASCMPQMNFGEAVSVNADGDNACRYETLFNVPLKEIPEAAVVSAASLVLHCINAGDPVTVSYAEGAWNELTVRWTTRPEVGKALGTITCEQVGEVTIDLTAAVKAFLAGTHANYGIYLRMETTDGIDYATSEANDVGSRPLLSVTYTLPIK